VQYVILGIVFVAIVGVIVGSYLYVNRRQISRVEAARARLADAESRLAPEAVSRSILKDQSVSSVPFLERALADRSWTDRLTLGLERGGVAMKPGAFVLLVTVCAALGLFVGTLLVFGWLAVFGLLVGALAPFGWLKLRQRKRLRKLEEQLPDAIDMLVSSMRAGYSFQAAMRFIGDEVADPVGTEFSRFYDEQRLGMDVRTSLLEMQERVGSLDLKMFVTAVLIQRETGGNLSEILGNISGVMRERAAIRGEIETLTAESKMSAKILTAVPITLFIALWWMDPQYMDIMFTQLLGQIMIAVGLIMIASGYSLMMKIANVDI
jgi:tight adherence protein B